MLEKEQTTHRYLMNILMKLKQFKDNDKLCDITISVHGKQFNAHKAILAAWSPKLANTILSLNGSKINLTMTYTNENAFSDVLEYLYSGCISPQESNVQSLIDIGKNLMIDSLVNVCEDYLKTSTSLGNFVSRYFTSLKYGLTSLEQYVVTFVETNILFVIEQDALLALPPQDLKCLLTMGKMSQAKREIKFTIIINWIGYDIGSRDKYLLMFIKNLNWNSSVNDLLLQISSMENIFTNNEFCLFQLLHSIVASTGHQLGPFMNTYARLLSVYSHMLEDLLRQDLCLVSSIQVNMIDPIPISAELVKPERTDCGHLPEKRDAEVNTDVDSSYFSEEQHQDNDSADIITTSGAADKDVKDHELQLKVYDDSGEVCEQDVYIDLPVVSNEDSVKLPEKHRRKNTPRKIPPQDAKEKKVKKKRGRPKKVKKEADVLPDANEQQRTIDEYGGETDTEYANVEELNKVGIEADEKLKGTVEVKLEKIDLEHHTAEKSDKRKRIRLKYKAVKAKHDVHRARKNKMGNFATKLGVGGNRRRHYKCSADACNFRSRSEAGLLKHIENSHSVDVQLKCKKCDYSTSQMRLLCAHMKQHYTKVPYACDEAGCSQKFFRMGLLVRHQMSHMNERPYKCDVCPKSYGTFNQLSCHKKLHEGRQFECDVCYKRFTTKGAMQTHRAIHFDDKPYLCDTCGFSTKHLSHLSSHRKIHTGDVLRCSFPDCNYSTPKQGHMTQHMNMHLNIRNHICQVCGKSFVVRSKLLRHERIHLKDKLFKCKQCDYQTSRTDRMKLHIESHGIKFKKKKYNLPNVEEEKPQIDYHQMYERVQPSEQSSETARGNSFNISTVSEGDIKMDALTLAANASMIVDTFTTVRLDQLGSASVSSLEEMQAAAFQNYESEDVVLS